MLFKVLSHSKFGPHSSYYILSSLWDSLFGHFGQHIPGGATKYSSTTRREFCSSSSAQLPSTTLSDLKYRHLQKQSLRLPSQRTGLIGDGWRGSRIEKTREQHILELWSLLKGGEAMVSSSLKDNL